MSAATSFDDAFQTVCKATGLVDDQGMGTVSAHRFRYTLGEPIEAAQSRWRAVNVPTSSPTSVAGATFLTANSLDDPPAAPPKRNRSWSLKRIFIYRHALFLVDLC
jgi:hypothetical protein